MKRRVDIRAEALDEWTSAAAWYEGQRKGLGLEFTAQIDLLVSDIAERPLSFPQWVSEDPVRRALVPRFPYSVMFDLEEDRVWRSPTAGAIPATGALG